jgi:hypothetical protein
MDGVDAIFEHLGLVPYDKQPIRGVVVMRLSARSPVVSLPPGAQEIAQHDDIRAWSAGRQIYLTCAGHTVRLHPTAGIGDGALPSLPSSVRKDVVIYGLLLLLRHCGLYGLHASGVSGESTGFLFVAGRGSGKSTHTYSLVRQGWEYLGDDAVLLRSHYDQVEALALRQDLYLDTTMARRFPEMRSDRERDDFTSNPKQRLAMHRLFPEQQIDRCVPRVLLFPEITSATRSQLVPLKPAAALPRLIAESAVFSLDVDLIPQHLEVLSQLALQAQSYRLLAGQDLEAEPELVADLFRDLPQSSWNPGTPGLA